ncbi:hypothetical protein QE152_g23340 [Popillia japonica]|uniref:Uncharacterized protein n=1 Tax=Popillia japonica TaxID=7064 RepID=A0AAW1KHX1_POPJA
MVMSKILSTLPEQYKYFLTAWESTPISDKTITNLTSRLVAEELRNKVRENDIAVAFKSSEKQCYKCKSKGHTSNAEDTNETGTGRSLGEGNYESTTETRTGKAIMKVPLKQELVEELNYQQD